MSRGLLVKHGTAGGRMPEAAARGIVCLLGASIAAACPAGQQCVPGDESVSGALHIWTRSKRPVNPLYSMDALDLQVRTQDTRIRPLAAP